MKRVASALVAGTLIFAATPVFAQGTDNGSSGSVPGLGPGGNGKTSNGSGATGTAPGSAGTAGSAPAGVSSGESQNRVLQQQGVPAGNKPAE